MNSSAKFSLAGLLLCASLSAAFAAEPALISQAKALMDQGNPHAAYALLAPRAQDNAGDVDFDYIFGMAAVDAGKPSEGVFALERVLAVKPDHAQARAEIARAYLMLGETDTSRQEFEAVKRANPPPEVLATIERYMGTLDKITAGQKTQVTGSVELSLGTDNNVNGSSGASQVALPAFGGLVFNQGAAGTKQRDDYYSLMGAINVRHPVSPNLTVFAGGNFFQRRNSRQADNFDTGSLDATAGMTLAEGEHQFTASLQSQTFYLDNARYREANGATLQWQLVPNANAQYGVYVQYSDLQYPTQPTRDAERYVLGTSVARALGGSLNPVIFGGLYVGRESVRDNQRFPQFGFDLMGIRGGGQMNLTPEINLFATLSYEERRYKGVDPLFLSWRKDEQFDARVGLNYALAPNVTLTPSVNYTQNRSNIVINQNDRTQASVSLRMDF